MHWLSSDKSDNFGYSRRDPRKYRIAYYCDAKSCPHGYESFFANTGDQEYYKNQINAAELKEKLKSEIPEISFGDSIDELKSIDYLNSEMKEAHISYDANLSLDQNRALLIDCTYAKLDVQLKPFGITADRGLAPYKNERIVELAMNLAKLGLKYSVEQSFEANRSVLDVAKGLAEFKIEYNQSITFEDNRRIYLAARSLRLSWIPYDRNLSIKQNELIAKFPAYYNDICSINKILTLAIFKTNVKFELLHPYQILEKGIQPLDYLFNAQQYLSKLYIPRKLKIGLRGGYFIYAIDGNMERSIDTRELKGSWKVEQEHIIFNQPFDKDMFNPQDDLIYIE